MGRTAGWLKKMRPEMVTVLLHIQQRSPYTAEGVDRAGERGGMALLLKRLAHVSAGAHRARSLPAMRQAWWRWTTAEAQGGTPPVADLARITRHASREGWLSDLTEPSCLALLRRLDEHLIENAAPARRTLETAWRPATRVAVDDLFEFLERRQLAGQDPFKDLDGEMPVHFSPPAGFVQEQVQVMLTSLVDQVLIALDRPRLVFKAPEEEDDLLPLHEGWPAALRETALKLSELIEDAARSIEAAERAHHEVVLKRRPHSYAEPAKRIKLFREGQPKRETQGPES